MEARPPQTFAKPKELRGGQRGWRRTEKPQPVEESLNVCVLLKTSWMSSLKKENFVGTPPPIYGEGKESIIHWNLLVFQILGACQSSQILQRKYLHFLWVSQLKLRERSFAVGHLTRKWVQTWVCLTPELSGRGIRLQSECPSSKARSSGYNAMYSEVTVTGQSRSTSYNKRYSRSKTKLTNTHTTILRSHNLYTRIFACSKHTNPESLFR